MSQQVFERLYPAPPTLSAFDRVSLVSYRIFKGPAGRIAKSIPLLRDGLLRSNMRVTPIGLISVALLATLISGIAVLGVIAWAVTTPFIFLYLLAPAPLIVFILIINGPKISRSSRGAALENELPFVVGYMSILAGGGLSLIETLRQISDMSIFPAASKEAQRILIDIDVFGHDPITALDRAAKYSPSRLWEELLTGYTTVLRTGGDYVNYLNLHLKDSFDAMAERVKRTVDTVGLVSESFLIVAVVLGMTLFTLYLVEALVNGNSGGLTNIYLFAFLIVPIISAGFTWLVDAVQPKWPFTDMRPYKAFGASVPVGIILFLLPIPIRFYIHLAIALIAISAAPAFLATKYSRERRTIERMLPEFIKDVAEGRKIGLPPEESIERIGEGEKYKALSSHVNKMASQLSWGLSLRKVIGSFSNEVNSWVAKAVGTLMLEVVEIGGGTLKGFEEMASFTRKVSNVEADARSALRPYTLVAYVGGLMLIFTTFMMLYLLTEQASLGVRGVPALTTVSSPGTLDGLLAASIFQTWVIGLVAGKMGEGSISEGFKHSLALVVLNIVAVVIAGRIIALPI